MLLPAMMLPDVLVKLDAGVVQVQRRVGPVSCRKCCRSALRDDKTVPAKIVALFCYS